jgi:TRAP-type C4-dicarboxylate transport system permease small subunit
MLDKFFIAARETIDGFCRVLLMAQVVVVSIVVIGRYVFNRTPGWGEEGALLFMVWFCLISSSLAIIEERHLRMSIIDYFLSPKQLRILDYFNHTIIFIFAATMFWEGIKLTQLTALNMMPGLGIKSSWLFASIPVAGVAIVIMTIEKFREYICKRT